MPTASKKSAPSHFKSLESLTQPPPVTGVEPRGPGRPRAKRSDPQYRSWSGLIKIQTVDDAVIRLRKTRDGRDMSVLVGDLLDQWLATPERPPKD